MSMDTLSSGSVASGVFHAFRTNGSPSYYDENQTAWRADIVEAGLIFAICTLGLAFYCIIPGVHGRDRLFTFLWVTVSLFVGGVILVTNFSYEWEKSEIQTTTKYKAGTGQDISANIGLHIGLRGVNITLKGEPVHQLNETINYNEHFSWEWEQGRLGFGPFASRYNREYRAAQLRGLPLPILWVAEYFTLDGEGFRWGRHYREAGLFAYMCLWLAVPLWLLSNILFFVLLRYGAYFLILTGISMCIANIIKCAIRNTLDLEIPFSSGHVIKPQYGSAFWLCLTTGIVCIVVGCVILLMDLRAPTVIARFFGVDVLQDDNTVIKNNTNLRNLSTCTIGSDATGIVEVTDTGEVMRTIGPRPPGAPPNGSNVKKLNDETDELTEIIEIKNDGATKTTDLLSNSAPPQVDNNDGDHVSVVYKPNYAKHVYDVYGEDEWTDASTDDDMDPTDEEYEESDIDIPDDKQNRKGYIGRFIERAQTRLALSRGIVQNLQKPRRPLSGKPVRETCRPKSSQRSNGGLIDKPHKDERGTGDPNKAETPDLQISDKPKTAPAGNGKPPLAKISRLCSSKPRRQGFFVSKEKISPSVVIKDTESKKNKRPWQD